MAFVSADRELKKDIETPTISQVNCVDSEFKMCSLYENSI